MTHHPYRVGVYCHRVQLIVQCLEEHLQVMLPHMQRLIPARGGGTQFEKGKASARNDSCKHASAHLQKEQSATVPVKHLTCFPTYVKRFNTCDMLSYTCDMLRP
jgi:hypothetical protein